MKLFNFFLIEYFFTKGQGYASKNMLDLAVQSYDKALNINQREDGVYLHKATALSRLGKHEDAIKTINRAIELNCGNPVYFLFAGIICLDAGLTEESLKYFEKSSELDKSYVFPRQYRSLALLKAKKINDAVAAFEKEGFPLDSKFKSRAFIIINEIKDKLTNEEFHATRTLIEKLVCQQKGRFNVTEPRPKEMDPKAAERLALQLKQLGAFEKAIEVSQAILAKNQDNYKVVRLLAEIYFETQKFVEAELFYKRAGEKFNNDADVFYYLGLSQYKQGKFREAVESLSKALCFANGDIKSEIAYWLGNSYWKQNQTVQAVYYLAVSFENIEGVVFEKRCLETMGMEGSKE